MVSTMDAFAILNRSVLDVANETVLLNTEEIKDKPYQVRLEEAPYSIAERRNRVEGTVVVAHDLTQYVNKFYSIILEANKNAPIDYLICHKVDELDLTEFGEYV